MEKILALLYEKLSQFKDADGNLCYCVRLTFDGMIKIYPNSESSRTIITTSALSKVIEILHSASLFLDLQCFVSTYSGLPCLVIYKL